MNDANAQRAINSPPQQRAAIPSAPEPQAAGECF
jgi:hypothetical protein